jgi:magnesium transporter
MANDKHVKEIKTDALTWVHVSRATKVEADELKRRFKFHDVDLKDVLPPTQRPKLVEQPEYLFMILIYPVFDEKTRQTRLSEVDFFMSGNLLVTVNDGDDVKAIHALFEECRENQNVRDKYFAQTPALLLYEILSRTLFKIFPMLIHVGNDIDEVERDILTQYGRETISEILRIKTNLVDVRRAMQQQPMVIEKLIVKAPKFFSIAKLRIYFNDLVEHNHEIWDTLESYKDAINALHETNESLLSLRVNEIIKTLTVFSVLLLPMTLVTGILGMNISVPYADSPYSLAAALGLIALVGAALLLIFKKKRWL